MKSKRTKTLALFTLALAIAVCGIIGMSASAEEVAPTVTSANVAYNDMMHLVFIVDNDGALPEGAKAGIVIWDKEQTEYTADNAAYATFTARLDGETTYYRSYGIAATEIDSKIYVAAGYLLDGAITVTQTPFEYSLVDYFLTRLEEDITPAQSRLYYNVLAYGLASEAVLGGNTYTLVKAEGGYVGAYNRSFAVLENASDTVMLRAQAVNADGDYFTKWVDDAGNTVSTDRVCTVAPGKSGESAYTAVFGNQSPYKHAVGFDGMDEGVIDFGTPDLSVAPTRVCYGTYDGTNYRAYVVSYKGIPSTTLNNVMMPAATVTGETKADRYTFTLDENGKYVIEDTDVYTVIAKNEGDNILAIDKNHGGTAWGTEFTNPTGQGKRVEFDVGCDDVTQDAVQICFTFRLNNGSTTSNYRINLMTAKDETGYLYAEQATSGSRDENKLKLDGNVSTYLLGKDKMLSIACEVNTSGEKPVIDVYLDGEYAGSLACDLFKGYSEGFNLATAQITYLGISAVSNTRDEFLFDNICFK